jgi:hypothetical protein
MEGFQPKATRIVLLEEEAVNLDFILDPNRPDGQMLGNDWFPLRG